MPTGAYVYRAGIVHAGGRDGVRASAQPVNLEIDANDNLWFTSASNAPANHLFQVTPSGTVTEISDFSNVFNWVNLDPVPPVAYLTYGHVKEDNSGVLVGLKADGSVSFYQLPTGLPLGPGQYDGRTISVAVAPDEWHGGQFYRSAFWYTDNNVINEYGPESQLDRFPLPDSNDVAASIALGGDGNLWFVENSIHVSPTLDTYYVADKIGKITTDGTLTTYDVKLAGFRLQIGPLVRGTDGSIWFNQVGVEEDGATPEPNTHRIGRINPDGTISRYISPDASLSNPPEGAVAVSPAGSVTDSPTFSVTFANPQASTVNSHSLSELTPVPTPNVAPVAVNDSYTVTTGNTLTVPSPACWPTTPTPIATPCEHSS